MVVSAAEIVSRGMPGNAASKYPAADPPRVIGAVAVLLYKRSLEVSVLEAVLANESGKSRPEAVPSTSVMQAMHCKEPWTRFPSASTAEIAHSRTMLGSPVL